MGSCYNKIVFFIWINITSFVSSHLHCCNSRLIDLPKDFKTPQQEWFFRLRNFTTSHRLSSTYCGSLHHWMLTSLNKDLFLHKLNAMLGRFLLIESTLKKGFWTMSCLELYPRAYELSSVECSICSYSSNILKLSVVMGLKDTRKGREHLQFPFLSFLLFS